MAEPFPALDYKLSPYTGWTREHWQVVLARLTYGYLLAAERQGSPARALFPDDRCDRPDSVDALEAFARLATAWGAWLRNPANPAALHFCGREMNLETLLRQALLDGTDPANPRVYWGDIGRLDQRIVEAAEIAVALWLSRERVFNRMTDAERAQVIAWLAQVDRKETYPDNWILFPAMSSAVRLQLGYPASAADLDSRVEQMGAFYRGEGWYADGGKDEFDLYNAGMFGWHYLLWAKIDGARRPNQMQVVLSRARSFLAGFQHFFGANGVYVPWGRSLVGRFGAVVAFAAGYWLNVAPARPGRLRRLSSGCIKYFFEHGCFDPEGHFTRQGFHGHFPPAGESYIAPGSPLTACHGLFALTFDHDDPFWTEVEAPLPVEREDFDLAFPTPGFALSGRRATGQVILLNSRSGHEADVARHDYTPKYGKFVYSTHFPFNVLPASDSYAPDAMIALTDDGRTFGHRNTTRAAGAAPGMIWCEFDETLRGQLQRVWAAVLLWGDLQVRLAWIRPARQVRAFEAPGTLGCAGPLTVLRRSSHPAGWEYAEAEGRAIGIRRLYGYDGQSASAPFLDYSNLNLAYPYSEQPLVFETQPSTAARAVAAVSLARPAGFDPDREFSGFAVTPEPDASFRVAFPDGEAAFAALGHQPPRAVTLNGVHIEGEGLRCVRLKPGAVEGCGLGVTRVSGVASLDSPGTLRWFREPDGAFRVTTDGGVSISSEWLGGSPRQVEVMALDGTWVDATEGCQQNAIPSELVRGWSQQNERRLVEFRLTA